MNRLLEFLGKLKNELILIGLVIISSIFLSFNQNQQISHLRVVAFGFFTSFDEYISIFTRYFQTKDELEILRQENLFLSEEVYRLRSARLENIQLRNQLSYVDKLSFRSIPADVITKSVHQNEQTITINVGKNHGVKEHQLVRSGQGVLGRIILASNNYSVVQLMISKNFKMASKIQRTGTEGIISWTGPDLTHVELSNIVQTAPIKEGDPIVTSPYSTFAPEGIPVGVVDSILIQPTALFKKVRVKTFADLTKIQHVYVVISLAPDSTHQEINSLQPKVRK